MRRPVWKWPLFTVLTLIAASVTAWVWLRYDFEKVNWAWGVVAGIIALYVVVDQSMRDRYTTPGTAARHRRAIFAELAELVRRDPTDEALLRAVEEPYPLPVTWVTADNRLQVSWRVVGRSSDGSRLDLAGSDGQLWNCYARIPSGRMLLLGPPGSGKSIVALRLARHMPQRTDPETPVPVLVGIASWDPSTEHFHRWLVATIAHRYPELASVHPRPESVLRDLVETDLVLPVLDGLDEVPAERLARCLDELNLLPMQRFVLTCGADAYERYLLQGEKLRGAAVVTLQPLDPARVADYLVDAAPFHQVGNWRTVSDEIVGGANPELTAALSTPLMVAMARTVFDSPGTDPRELARRAGERGRREAEDDLLGRAVDVALRSRRGEQVLRPGELERAPGYLSFLAAHLENADRRELVWWRLTTELPRLFWVVYDGVWAAAAIVISWVLTRDALAWTANVVPDADLRAALRIVAGDVHQAVWPVAALVMLLSALDSRDVGPPPTRIAFVGGPGRFQGGLVEGLLLGTFWGTGTWLLTASVTVPTRIVTLLDRLPGPFADWPVGVRAGLVVGLSVVLVRAVRAGLRVDFAAPARELGVAGPASIVRADRAAAILSVVPAVFGAAVGVGALFQALSLTGLLPAAPPLAAQAYAGLGIGLGWWVHRMSERAWTRFTVATLVLATRHAIPLRLLRFLAFAESAGLLRHSRGSYRFRHGRLQRRLAAKWVGRQRGTGLREEFGTELARMGYWEEALAFFDAVFTTRAANLGLSDDRAVDALCKALLAGGAAGSWQRLERSLTQIPAPVAPDPTVAAGVAAQRHRVAALLAGAAPLEDLLVACDDLLAHEGAVGHPEPATLEFRAALRWASGDRAGARAALDVLVADPTQGDGSEVATPIGAALCIRAALDDDAPGLAAEICDYQLRISGNTTERADLLRLAESWRWSVTVLRRVTDEPAELRRRVAATIAAGRAQSPAKGSLSAREVAEIGIMLCRRLIDHPMLGNVALAGTRGLAWVLDRPEIFRRVINRSAPMWHDI